MISCSMILRKTNLNMVNNLNLVPRAIMSFSCRTQPPVMTVVSTYTFVGNLFQAFVMYALRWPPWFKTIWFGSRTYMDFAFAGQKRIEELHLFKESELLRFTKQ